MSAAPAVGVLALTLVLAQAVRLSTRVARRLGGAPLFPAVLAVALGLLAVALAEGLSLVHGVRRAGIAASVAAALVATIALGWPRVRFREWTAALRASVRAGGDEGRLAAGVLGLLGAVTLFLALASPPNTDDALVYHLPPIRHWLERGTVAHYPTTIDRLRTPPLAAYLRLPLEALTGSDALFGLVQWLFYAIAVGQAAGLAWLVTGSPRLAWRAALIAGTLPMAVLQASSTQNDLVVSGYVMGAAAAITALARGAARPGSLLLLAGGCVGLGGLTKGTGLLLAVVLLPALLAACWWRRDAADRPRGSAVLASLLVAAALVAPLLVRNHRTFGTLPRPEAVPARAWLEAAAPARALYQLARGALVQIQPLLARQPLGGWILGAHQRVFGPLGLEDDEPLLRWTGDAAFLARTSPRHEDTAGNPLHFLLALWAGGVALRRRDPWLLGLWGLGGAAWLALTVPIRFSPWLGRLQLPALLLLAVPMALALGAPRRRALLIGVVLAAGSLPPLLMNAMKPLVPRGSEPGLFTLSRWENRFRSRPALRPAVETALAGLPESCAGSTVGLRVGAHQAEYALWAGARHFGRELRFAHLASATVPAPAVPVCAVISDRCAGGGALCREEPR